MNNEPLPLPLHCSGNGWFLFGLLPAVQLLLPSAAATTVSKPIKPNLSNKISEIEITCFGRKWFKLILIQRSRRFSNWVENLKSGAQFKTNHFPFDLQAKPVISILEILFRFRRFYLKLKFVLIGLETLV